MGAMPKITSEIRPENYLEIYGSSLDFLSISISDEETDEVLGSIVLDRPGVIELLEYLQEQGIKL